MSFSGREAFWLPPHISGFHDDQILNVKGKWKIVIFGYLLDGWKISAILFNKSLVVFYPFALKNLCKLENACVLSLSYILSIKTFLTNSSVEIIPLIYVIKLQISLCNFFSQLVRYQIRKTAVHLLWLLTSVPQNECAFPII